MYQKSIGIVMSIVKVFVPEDFPISDRLLGDVIQQSNGSSSFYINEFGKYIGGTHQTPQSQQMENFLRFHKSTTNQMFVLDSVRLDHQQVDMENVQLYLYNTDEIKRLNVSETCIAQKDVLQLTKLVQGSINEPRKSATNSLVTIFSKLKMLLSIFPAVSSHFHYWLSRLDEYSFKK